MASEKHRECFSLHAQKPMADTMGLTYVNMRLRVSIYIGSLLSPEATAYDTIFVFISLVITLIIIVTSFSFLFRRG